MGAWIETIYIHLRSSYEVSHPMWVRGLKPRVLMLENGNLVAPYVGAWIETNVAPALGVDNPVAPYVGAWIETCSAARYDSDS